MINNPFSMTVLIVAIVMITQLLKAKYRSERKVQGEDFASRGPNPEAEQLRIELKSLKDRVAVLERLATDESLSLEREFDKLRSTD